ncbi:hypothetical protein [Streptomyces zagrosensis]|uniref:Uncharacterized protein n=1 Tax=Streptomyces zagrosensis TaxID=1042984 RepID=A0A7W9QFL5_9ACTN|nr:hypothetical protein [Streptomyces zagrosensis]MBB5939370.1 hypothetical protein [Streptomyces zagrosensis]
MPPEASTPTPSPHDWIPPGGGVRWTRVGELGWHTLTLPTYLGDRVLVQLGDAGGAVIQEDIGAQMTWLTAPHAPALLGLPDHGTMTISGDADSYVFVPGMTRTDLVWWRVAPTPDRLLTDAEHLTDAITTVRANRAARASRATGGAACGN